MTGHIKILNDPVELVPLLITFNNADYKKIYDLLNKAWLTEEELGAYVDASVVTECLSILKKGNLIEEQWRMPKPGQKPMKEYRTTYSKFRANFQCSMGDIGDLLHIAISNDESLRAIVDSVEQEISAGTTSIGDISRKYGVSPIFIKGLAKRIPSLDVKGQGMVLLDRPQ
ncbi:MULTISPECIES: ArsR family transcriptional regulator [Methanoculleus]|uniref:Predicted DNA-binding transcriptional regulator, ArsR family n=1 Tax=Methanoculleus thermophilus TaxID=2200 RepID=A0A1G8Z903_9EURY|nr:MULTISPECIES: ArsR family transcriptional regulator [Methanoculleus]NLN09649.1 ArsR family transcriptional regulator [Methanoculleus thermophilus]SDK11552.1 Predicted DNA-binding transcriptional regulator, ArsR family [Methanoculleus thermophilus]HQD25357.1 ArsR family transcriptional regulator [Methanoculleus thermophilus]